MPATTRTRPATASRSRKPERTTGANGGEAIFTEIRSMLERYAPPFVARTDSKGGYHLWSAKGMVDQRGKTKDCFFAGVIPQTGYIGFYYMPVYTNPERKAMFEPELLSLLKGKSCFYVRRLEPAVKRQMRAALRSGFRLYKERGWV